jgi:hypothetical protein
MSLWEEMANDGASILAELGRPVVFRGVTYSALLDQNPLEQMMQDGGFVYRAGFKVRLLVVSGDALYTTPPHQGEIFTIFGREYTITSITSRRPSPWLDCMVISTTQ